MKTMNKKYIYAGLVALLIVLSPIFIHAVREFGACGSTAKGCEGRGNSAGTEAVNCEELIDDEIGDCFDGQYEVCAEEKCMATMDSATNRMGSSETSMPAKKIIENYQLSMETENFDSAVASIKAVAEDCLGFVKSFDVYGSGTKNDPRNASFEVKIPAEKSAEYMESVKALGKVLNESKNVDDVSKVYSDIEVEIRNYEEAEDRYLELYEKAETIEDMLRVENELARLRNMIDIRKAELKNYDYLVSYSTIRLSLREVVEEREEVIVEPNVWQKAQNGFVASVNSLIKAAQNLFIALVSALPGIFIVLVFVLIVVVVVKSRKKKAVKTITKKEEQ